jgi:type IV secretion system protein VirB6
MLLTGLLTLYVVFIGYRLILGRGGLRSATPRSR